MYADNSKFTSTSGAVTLNSCHGNSLINVQDGDLSIGKLVTPYYEQYFLGFIYMYMQTILRSASGAITLSSCHGNSLTSVQDSDLSIGKLSCSIFLQL